MRKRLGKMQAERDDANHEKYSCKGYFPIAVVVRHDDLRLHGHTLAGHGLPNIHLGVIHNGIRDPGFIGQADGRVPFGLVVVFPHLVVQRFSAGADTLADDVAELEVLLIDDTLRPVDDRHLDCVILTADVTGYKLQLDPQVIIQFCQHGFPDEFGILEHVLVIKHLAHFFFKEVHCYFSLPPIRMV